MSKRDSEADFAELGRRDGEAAGRRAIAVLPRSDAPGRLGRAVERELAERKRRAAEMVEPGASPASVTAYRAGWEAGLDSALNDLTEAMLPMLPEHDDG